jgi:hypothetical protein
VDNKENKENKENKKYCCLIGSLKNQIEQDKPIRM